MKCRILRWRQCGWRQILVGPDLNLSRVSAAVGGITTGVFAGLYNWTAAPGVTLLDAGEFMTAAAHFGVPHPPGYPLWTFLGWIFQGLMPTPTATALNLFSAWAAALALGLAAALASEVTRWMSAGRCGSWAMGLAGLTAGGLAGVSEPIWSQAVITEVYSLHLVLVTGFLWCLLVWVREPGRGLPLVWSVGMLVLAVVNHPLALALVPLWAFTVLLFRPQVFSDLLMAGLVGSSWVLVGFSRLGREELFQRTTLRWALMCMVFLGLWAWWRRGWAVWKWMGGCVLAGLLGLVPLVYMPLASSTHPPMDWGFTREPEGFFRSVNRSQYDGSLSSVLQSTLGRLTGSAGPQAQKAASWVDQVLGARLEYGARLRDYGVFTLIRMGEQWSGVGLILGWIGVGLFLRTPFPQRGWILTLVIGWLCTAFLFPALNPPGLDFSSQRLHLPFQGVPYLFFALLAAVSVGSLAQLRFPGAGGWIGLGLVFVVVSSGMKNWDRCSQRDHVFGEWFGAESLRELPRGAVVFGGTDPGRFVLTWMIFGESQQPRHRQRVPGFDRRDLVMMTQNALADPWYLRSLRDQYTEERPQNWTRWQRWLGRASMYPEGKLILPDLNQHEGLIRQVIEEAHQKGKELESGMLLGSVARWIFEKNRGQRPFFVEESIPLEWMHAHMRPAGFLWELEPEPVTEVPREWVERDQVFWKAWSRKLWAHPRFRHDVDARMTFAKLRNTAGNVWEFHAQRLAKQGDESGRIYFLRAAENAYRMAVDFSIFSTESVAGLVRVLHELNDFQAAEAVVLRAANADPHSRSVAALRATATFRRELADLEASLRQKLEKNPTDVEAALALVEVLARTNDPARVLEVASGFHEEVLKDVRMMHEMVGLSVSAGDHARAFQWTHEWLKKEPENANVWFQAAILAGVLGNEDEFWRALERAVELGGVVIRERILREPVMRPFLAHPRMKPFLLGEEEGEKRVR